MPAPVTVGELVPVAISMPIVGGGVCGDTPSIIHWSPSLDTSPTIAVAVGRIRHHCGETNVRAAPSAWPAEV